jgi:MacB-like periplasmic core domain
MATTLLPYNAAMRFRRYRTAFVALAVLALTACMPPPKFGAPQGSYAPATYKVKVAESEETVAGAAVTAQFFTTAKPQLGRVITGSEFLGGGAGVAVLSQRYWVERFQSSPTAIGQQIAVDGRARTIVGVMPEAFQPEGAGLIWIPGKNP